MSESHSMHCHYERPLLARGICFSVERGESRSLASLVMTNQNSALVPHPSHPPLAKGWATQCQNDRVVIAVATCVTRARRAELKLAQGGSPG